MPLSAWKGVFVKKAFVFMLIALALAIAMPVAAGPPVATLDAIVQMVAREYIFSGASVIIIKAPLVAVDPVFDSIFVQIRPYVPVIAATLAENLCSIVFPAITSSALFDPRDRMQALARDQTA